jgi:hypothetical protein
MYICIQTRHLFHLFYYLNDRKSAALPYSPNGPSRVFPPFSSSYSLTPIGIETIDMPSSVGYRVRGIGSKEVRGKGTGPSTEEEEGIYLHI